MNCSNCAQLLESGAAFCGNCGQPVVAAEMNPALQATPQPAAAEQSTIAEVWANQAANALPRSTYGGELAVPAALAIPSYAVPIASQQSGATKATMSVVLGGLGLVGVLFIPLVGIALAVAGLVLATLSRHSPKRRVSSGGLTISVVAVIAGMGFWAYAASHDPRLTHKVANAPAPTTASSAQSLASLTTPCYSVNFGSSLNVEHATGSCNMNAFDGNTLDNSTNAYKIFGNAAAAVTANNFTAVAKKAIENDVQQSLPTFSVSQEAAGLFAGSPAYFVTANNGAGVSVVEAAALHDTSNGDNFFVFVHAVGGNSVDLKSLEAGWQWQQ